MRAGADLNLMDQIGHTALDYACTNQATQSFMALLKAGADMNLPSNEAVVVNMYIRAGVTPEDFSSSKDSSSFKDCTRGVCFPRQLRTLAKMAIKQGLRIKCFVGFFWLK